jgi:hypothetical protein
MRPGDAFEGIAFKPWLESVNIRNLVVNKWKLILALLWKIYQHQWLSDVKFFIEMNSFISFSPWKYSQFHCW